MNFISYEKCLERWLKSKQKEQDWKAFSPIGCAIDEKMTVEWLPDDIVTTARRLPHDWLMTALWLPDDWLKDRVATSYQHYFQWKMTLLKIGGRQKTEKKLRAYEAAYMVSDLLTLVHSKIKGFLDNHTFTRKSSLSHSFQHRQLCPQRKNSLLQSIIISNWASKGQEKSSILFLDI